MEPAEMQRMFDYLIDTRTRFLERFQELPWDAAIRDRGASWDSLVGILLHVLDDEEAWLQFAARGRALAEAPDRRVDAYSSWPEVRSDHEKVSSGTRDYLRGLTAVDLAEEVEFRESTGLTRRIRQTILLHAFVDELAHVGELVCLAWQEKLQPPFIDWIDYRIA
jgi:uncharacterized damage-inducible protein DinB